MSRSKLDKNQRSPSKTESSMTPAFKNVLDYFQVNGVGLVVRCNDRLYDKREFEMRGMKHTEMVS
jgi:cell division cycle 14